MESLYTDSAARMPYDAPVQEGRAAIIQGYRTSFAARQMTPDIALLPSRIMVREPLAVERGRYREVLHARASDRTVTEVGKYVAVYSRDRQGSWRFEWSIFNRDARPAPHP